MSNYYIRWFIAFFVIISAFRWNVGSDSLAYALDFKNGYSLRYKEGSEILWRGLVSFISNNHIPYWVGMGIVAFFQFFFIVKAVKEYRCILLMLPFMLFGSRYWMELSGACRQMVVACVFLYASRFIIDKKPFKYFVVIYICSFVHHSALFLLPFYFSYLVPKIYNRRILLSAILIMCVLIGQTPKFEFLTHYVEQLSLLTDYDHYIDYTTNSLTFGSEEKLSFGLTMSTYLFIPLIIIWSWIPIANRYNNEIKYLNLWYNFSYFYSCAYFLVYNLGHVFIRPFIYFCIFQMVTASLVLYHSYTNRKQTVLNMIFFILMVVTLFLYVFWMCYQGCINYKVIFNHNSLVI